MSFSVHGLVSVAQAGFSGRLLCQPCIDVTPSPSLPSRTPGLALEGRFQDSEGDPPSCLGFPRTRSTSACVGFWPSARSTSPHCPKVIFNSPLGVRSNSMKASLNSVAEGVEGGRPQSAPHYWVTLTQTGGSWVQPSSQKVQPTTYLQSARE